MKKILLILGLLLITLTTKSQIAITGGTLWETKILSVDFDYNTPIDIGGFDLGLIYDTKYFALEGGVFFNINSEKYCYAAPTLQIPFWDDDFSVYLSYKYVEGFKNVEGFNDAITSGVKTRYGYGSDVQIGLGVSPSKSVFLFEVKFFIRPWHW